MLHPCRQFFRNFMTQLNPTSRMELFMAGFTNLPSEILLKILRTLYIPDIHAFGLVCKHFDAVIKDNSSSVYRLAAVLHRYISSPSASSSSFMTLLEQSTRELYGNQSQITISSWLEYCKIRWRIDRAWNKPLFPQETVNFRQENSFLRICREGDTILISPDIRHGIGAIDALTARARRTTAVDIEWSETTGELVRADDGFLLFKLRATLYRVWSHTETSGYREPSKDFDTFFDSLNSQDIKNEARAPLNYSAGLRFVGDIQVDGRCDGMKLKDQCLMMTTDRNTLYIFDLTSPEFEFSSPSSSHTSNGTAPPTMDPTSTANIITPSGTIDLWSLGKEGLRVTPDDNVGYTTCIDFSDQYIFHATSEKLRVISRTTHKIVYSIHEASWQNVAPGKWSKCITPHAFVVPAVTGQRVFNPQWGASVMDSLTNEIVQVEPGTGPYRKDRPWRWDVMQMAVKNGMLVMSFGGGWIVGLPDIEMLVDGTRMLEDADACWVLDIGAPCTDMLFDGRRIVWNHNSNIAILNLYPTEDMRVQAGMPVVRISQREWTATETSQTMVLTDRAVWFLGGGRKGGWDRPIHLIHWAFGE